MQPLNDDGGVVVEGTGARLAAPMAVGKVEDGKIAAPVGEKLRKAGVKEFQVNQLDRLKIEGAVFENRRFPALFEEIVEGDLDGADPALLEGELKI